MSFPQRRLNPSISPTDSPDDPKNGTQAAQDLDYIPLPDVVQTQIRTQWSSKVKDASGKAVAD